jgi:transposase
LPERHLARFVVEVVEGLDLRSIAGSYRGSGEASYHPELLLGLIVYGYATGVFSSRKLERATYDSVAFRFIAANEHPDRDTIAAFRRRFLKQIEPLFVQVLDMARELGVLKPGTVALDGTKIHANASRHSALTRLQKGRRGGSGADCLPPPIYTRSGQYWPGRALAQAEREWLLWEPGNDRQSPLLSDLTTMSPTQAP